MGLFQRFAVAMAVVAVTGLAACDSDSPAAATDQKITKAGCLDFNITITNGPDSGKTYDGDLMMSIEPTGFFKAALVPVDPQGRETITIPDSTKIIARATGQANGASVTWILYSPEGKPIYGSGMIDLAADPQVLRGIVSGPDPADVGVFHGRWFPPYIRPVSSQ